MLRGQFLLPPAHVFLDEFLFVQQFLRIGAFAPDVLLFLVPPPFVDLGLRKSRNLRHLYDLLLGPVGYNI